MAKRRRSRERTVAAPRRAEAHPAPSPWVERLSTLAIAGLYALVFTKHIQLNAADLGRHLKNGEIILARLAVPTTNEYSYTAPDFPFLNHHWGSGVLLHLVHRVFGFPGLSLFAVVLAVTTFWLFFSVARRESRFEIAGAAALVMLPVIGSRIEIRPEMFSYLWSGVFLSILWRYARGIDSWRMLVLLPLIEVLWVNTHLYFFFGLVLVAAFVVEALLLRRRATALVITGAATALATLANPAGLRGALYPLSIMGNYGYDVVENQPALLLARLINFPPTLYFEVALGALAASWLYAFLADRRESATPSVALLLLSLFVSVLAWTAVRNFALFGWVALVAVSANLRGLREPAWFARRRAVFAPVLLGGLALALVLLHIPYWRGQLAFTGLGVRPGNLEALEFYRTEGLRGPIFNNFNVGSYLIYGLYPQERVFVDNRPEAYPATFFSEVLTPMLRDETRWREADERWHFNVIFFAHKDVALGPEFLERRAHDPAWAPVFADDDLIILVKRDEQNRDVIRRHELQVE